MALLVQGLQESAFPGVDSGQFLEYLFFSVTPSNTPAGYVAGGDTLSFVGASPLLTTNQPPIGPVTIQSQSAAAGHSGYLYYYRPATSPTQANGKMQVLTTGASSGAALAELAAGNYPSAITGDTIIGSASFSRS